MENRPIPTQKKTRSRAHFQTVKQHSPDLKTEICFHGKAHISDECRGEKNHLRHSAGVKLLICAQSNRMKRRAGGVGCEEGCRCMDYSTT